MLRFKKLAIVLLLLSQFSCKKDKVDVTPIVHIDYKQENIPDFSYAGYRQSESPIPFVKEVKVVSPEEGRDFANIQNAIDELAKEPLVNGFRGAILLKAGTYRINKTLLIQASGIVLRGEGQGNDGTIIIDTRSTSKEIPSANTRKKAQASIIIQGSLQVDYNYNFSSDIKTDFVKVAATSFEIIDNPGFNVGDTITVIKTTNDYWVDELNMRPFGWTTEQYQIGRNRVISNIQGNMIALNIPMDDQIKSSEGGGMIVKISYPHRISNSGIENIRFESSYTSDEDEMHVWNAIHLIGAQDCWVRNVTSMYYSHSAVALYGKSDFNTIQDCAMLEPKSEILGDRRYAFYVNSGTGNLFQRCFSDQGRHDFVTGARVSGPNVFLDGYAATSFNETGPHHRWATGTLYDNIYAGIIAARNRGAGGSGHGWSGAFNMFWNCKAAVSFKIENPPGAVNWLIGAVGSIAGNSYTASVGHPVEPRSLFITQLIERIGKAKVRDIVTEKQLNGSVWNDLNRWAGNGEPLKSITAP